MSLWQARWRVLFMCTRVVLCTLQHQFLHLHCHLTRFNSMQSNEQLPFDCHQPGMPSITSVLAVLPFYSLSPMLLAAGNDSATASHGLAAVGAR